MWDDCLRITAGCTGNQRGRGRGKGSGREGPRREVAGEDLGPVAAIPIEGRARELTSRDGARSGGDRVVNFILKVYSLLWNDFTLNVSIKHKQKWNGTAGFYLTLEPNVTLDSEQFINNSINKLIEEKISDSFLLLEEHFFAIVLRITKLMKFNSKICQFSSSFWNRKVRAIWFV
jgi:hypothetical protein